MSKRPNNSRSDLPQALAWLTATVFIVGIMGLGFILLFEHILWFLTDDPDRPVKLIELPVFLVVFSVVTVVLVYVGGIAWLLFAKLFFSRDEVINVTYYMSRPNRLERWLVDSLFPEKEKECD